MAAIKRVPVGVFHRHCIFFFFYKPDMLGIRHASVRKLAHMVEILLEYSASISLRKWSNFASPARMAMTHGTCMKK